MKDTQLYSQILGIQKPWKVSSVNVSLADDEVEVEVDYAGDKLRCPKCGTACPRYDRRPRRWRHLDTCQLKTLLMADVPRVECQEHGVVTVEVPWAEPGTVLHVAEDRVTASLGSFYEQLDEEQRNGIHEGGAKTGPAPHLGAKGLEAADQLDGS